MKITDGSNFFHDKPLFGMDIGHGSLKVMQVAEMASKALPKNPHQNHRPQVIGYGTISFDQAAQQDGVVVKPELIAKAAMELFEHALIGNITTRRVAIAIPAYHTFTRSLHLPALKPMELKAAVELEAEQYISVPLEELYLDYEITRQTADATELFVAAVPQAIVDSYLELTKIMGLETVLIEPTLSSSAHLFNIDDRSDLASLIIDFGSLSADISIFDKHVLASSTVQVGGKNFTNSIKDELGITLEEAGVLKTRYGLGVSRKQHEIKQALKPTLEQIVKEIQRMIRYYEERYGSERPIGQIITLGGGANMPGLTDYLIQALRMPVRTSDPWQYLNYVGLQPPPNAEKPMYSDVAGLSLVNAKEVFAS
jgi:type IV pilus assembly protein PilM